jgi:hypothetical protein
MTAAHFPRNTGNKTVAASQQQIVPFSAELKKTGSAGCQQIKTIGA